MVTVAVSSVTVTAVMVTVATVAMRAVVQRTTAVARHEEEKMMMMAKRSIATWKWGRKRKCWHGAGAACRISWSR